MTNEQIEIIIDKLIPKSNIKLITYNNFILIINFNVANSTLGYKLKKSNLYNLLMEQLNMKDSLVLFIRNNNTLSESNIVINNINTFNRIMYKLNRKKFTINFYGLNLEDIPVYSTR